MHTFKLHKLTSGIFGERFAASTSAARFARKFASSRLFASTRLLAAAASFLAAGVAQTALSQGPAVIANSTTTLASGFSAGPAVVDACGDVYAYESGGTGVVRIDAVTGAVTTVIKNPQGYQSVGPALYMDPAKANLYFPDFTNFYTAHFDQASIVNCQPGTINTNFANNIGSLTGYYYGTAQDVAADAAGNVYFNTTAGVQTAIYKETLASGAYTGTRVFNWTNNIKFIASDAAGDLFFVDSSTQNVYALMLSGGAYPATPTTLVAASKFGTISGLTLDPKGNLYISDSKTSLVYEVPLENGALNPAHLFAVASIGTPFKVAVDGKQNFYASNYSPGATEVTVGSAAAPATNVGATSGSFSVTYLFNSSITPTGFSVTSGTSSTSPFATATGGTCATTTAQAALTTCTVNATFKPTAVGQQTGVLSFTSASGTVQTDLYGTGLGSALTIDPGTVVPFTATLTAPSGVAVDGANNIYVTDTTANTLTMFSGPGGTATPVSTGTLTLKQPKGVTLDAAGDIFIADTGNNRIVEIPVVSGALKSAAAFALSTSVTAPQGVVVDRYGNLIIADTGDNTLLLVPNFDGALNFAATQTIASKLGGPGALALDPSGNLYVAEITNNDLLKFSGPVGSGPGVKVASGFSTPTGVAADASGSIFVVDSGTGGVDRFPVVNGSLGNKVLVGGSILNPVNVAIDNKGNLFVTDTADDTVNEITRVTAALQFGGVNVGSTGTQSSTLNNSGNANLVYNTPDYTVAANPAPGFAVTGDTCKGSTVTPGNSCTITATYTPTQTQLNAEEDLNLSANEANGSPVLQLIGTGARITPSTLSLALTAPAGATSLSAAQSVTFTATLNTGSNTAVAGGSVKFAVNGTGVGTVLLKSGQASITLKNGLPAGNDVITAVYSGDVVNYGSSSAQLSETVSPLSDGVTLAVVAPYNIPNSANDNSSVISVTMSRASGLVTATLPRTTTLTVGTAVAVTSSSNSSFNGGFTLTSVTNGATTSTVTWQQGGGPADVASGSAVSGTIAAREQLAAGPSIVLTATIAPSNTTLTPSGTVSFYAGSTLLGIASVAPSNDQATITTTALRAGTSSTIGNGSFISNYNLTAVYSGDNVYAAGTSNGVPISIVAPPSTTPACALTGSNGSAPTCLLNTTGATFTITPTNPTITVAAGQTGTTTLTITSYGGWSGVVTFTCANLPSFATCNPFPGTPLVNASTSTTNYPLTTVAFNINTNVPPPEVHTSSLAWGISGLVGLCMLLARRRLVRLGHLRARLLSVAGLLLLLGGAIFGISGCSTGVTGYVTPAGSSNVVVTVHSAQLVPGTTTGQVQTQDANDPSFTINLVVH